MLLTSRNREPSPFKRFEDFARRIVAVPKRELDEKQAEYDKRKADRKVQSA